MDRLTAKIEAIYRIARTNTIITRKPTADRTPHEREWMKSFASHPIMVLAVDPADAHALKAIAKAVRADAKAEDDVLRLAVEKGMIRPWGKRRIMRVKITAA